MSETEPPERTSLPPDYPPILYVPCVKHVTDPDDLEVEYRSTRDGRTALLVYSALDRLHKCCGVGQPWFLMPTLKLDDLYQVAPFDTVLLDVVLPDELKKPGPTADADATTPHAPADAPPSRPQSPAASDRDAEGDETSAYVGQSSLPDRLGRL